MLFTILMVSLMVIGWTFWKHDPGMFSVDFWLQASDSDPAECIRSFDEAQRKQDLARLERQMEQYEHLFDQVKQLPSNERNKYQLCVWEAFMAQKKRELKQLRGPA